MGWLYQKSSDFFVEDDGSYPEICICGLSKEQVIAAYKFIREKCRFVVGKPRFFGRDQACELELDEVECAATMVTEGNAHPFHFMVREIRFGRDWKIPEAGVFIMHNAVAFDYEKGRLWGELEIESLLILILKIMKDCPDSFIRLEESVSEENKNRFTEIVAELGREFAELPALSAEKTG